MSETSEPTLESLEKKLKTAQSARLIVGIIFALIIIAWVILGYWKTNVPVFISTLALAFTSILATSGGISSLSKKIEAMQNQ